MFREHPEVYLALCIESEDFMNSVHSITIAGSPLQKVARERFTAMMKEVLKDSPHIANTLIVCDR